MLLLSIMTYNDLVCVSRLKLFACLTISHYYWDKCEKLGLSPVGTRPVLVIDSKEILSSLKDFY